MTKAIIFDCFGVLVTESWLGFKREHFGHDQATFVKATQLMDRADAGAITHEEFLKRVAELSGISANEVEKELDTNRPNDELFEFIANKLKPKYKIGLLSNAASNWLRNFFSDQQLAFFDAISLSFETGIIKPDLAAFRTIAEQLGVKPHEAIFIDDQERHLNAAKNVGMRTILYKDFAQLKSELETTLRR